jgi:hypothetical protein
VAVHAVTDGHETLSSPEPYVAEGLGVTPIVHLEPSHVSASGARTVELL